MMKRISTGIIGLNKLFGGFKEKSINLVIGGTGSGKTIMVMQFLVDGIKKGEKGIYITFEEKKEKIYDDMLSFGWDLEKYEKAGKFVFLEYTPEQVKKIITEGGGEIENMVEKMKAKRIVIDSMTSFSLLYKDELARKEAALFLFGLINRWNCTALLTAQSQEENKMFSELEFEVDGLFVLYHKKRRGIRKRGLEVLKIRGTKIPHKTFPLLISDKGISINTRGIFTY